MTLKKKVLKYRINCTCPIAMYTGLFSLSFGIANCGQVDRLKKQVSMLLQHAWGEWAQFN